MRDPENLRAKYTAVDYTPDGGDGTITIVGDSGSGTVIEIEGTQAEIVKFVTDLAAAVMLGGDCG